MIIRSIEVGLACSRPNWSCCGDFNAITIVTCDTLKEAKEKFGLKAVPTIAGDRAAGKD